MEHPNGNSARENICERTFKFALRVVRLCQYLDRKPGIPRVLSAQLLRAGTSIGSNLEEAQAGQSRADFVHKASIALKECRETCYWLKLITAAQLVPPIQLQDLLTEATEIGRILGSIVVRTRRNTPMEKKRTTTDARR